MMSTVRDNDTKKYISKYTISSKECDWYKCDKYTCLRKLMHIITVIGLVVGLLFQYRQCSFIVRGLHVIMLVRQH